MRVRATTRNRPRASEREVEGAAAVGAAASPSARCSRPRSERPPRCCVRWTSVASSSFPASPARFPPRAARRHMQRHKSPPSRLHRGEWLQHTAWARSERRLGAPLDRCTHASPRLCARGDKRAKCGLMGGSPQTIKSRARTTEGEPGHRARCWRPSGAPTHFPGTGDSRLALDRAMRFAGGHSARAI